MSSKELLFLILRALDILDDKLLSLFISTNNSLYLDGNLPSTKA